MLDLTRDLWSKQNKHTGDRERLFRSVADFVPVSTVLYAGSFVDIAPSFVWPSVTYIDVDRRTPKFFADRDGIDEIIAEHDADPAAHEMRFIHGDYSEELEIEDESFDLLVSLYAGFISEHCTRYLRPGGYLLVNASHGDAAMASIDRRYRLHAVVTSQQGKGADGYAIGSADLDMYLIPKKEIDVTAELLHATGRGIAYTKSPFAYLFERRT